jgi:ABC-type branched-subunit amino acid transport system substrate-binding protein
MWLRVWLVGILAAAVGHGVAAAETAGVIKIGGMCDRTGASKVIGVELCPGVSDYIALVNRKGGVPGHRLEYTEIDHGYIVPRGRGGL